jgi:hypothetical protein
VDSCRLRLRNLLLNQRPPEEISLQMTIVARAEKELKTWRGLSEKLFHCQLYLEHIPSLIVLFQIGFGGTYLWTESMGNIQVRGVELFMQRRQTGILEAGWHTGSMGSGSTQQSSEERRVYLLEF